MRFTCKSAPNGYQRCIGQCGELRVASPPDLRTVFIADDGGQYPIQNVTEWHFEAPDPIIEAARFLPENPTQPSAPEPTPEHRRAREQYDANHFVIDLDQAINYVRSTALDVLEFRRREVQPHLKPGMSMRDSVFEVCLALAVRQINPNTFGDLVELALRDARQMLIAKNAAYGNSALDPVRVFSTASLKEQLLVRLDDKVSRLARGSAAGEDVAQDMLGYLLLVAIAEKRERENA